MNSTGFSLVYYLKNLDTNYSFLYLLSLIMCERVEKIIARTLCFMHQRIFRPIYIFNNYAFFFRFLCTKIPFDLFEFKSFLTLTSPAFWGFLMKNHIKKAPVKFWEDLLYFQHFMQFFVFAPN